MSEERESAMKDANSMVLQFCSAAYEGLDGVTTENVDAENFCYKHTVKASSCPQTDHDMKH